MSSKALSTNKAPYCTKPENRTVMLRTLFVSTMFITAVVFGTLAYTILTNSEENAALQTYESIAASALEEAHTITRNKQQGADSLATALSCAFPDASRWPFVGLRGFSALATKVALMSASAGHGFMTIVRPDQVEEFEAHAKALYRKFEYPETAGYSEFGFGIYGIDNSPEKNYTDGRFHDASGDTMWNSKYKIMVPFLQLKNTFSNPALLQRNVYQFESRGRLMESIIDCSNEAKEAAEAADIPEMDSDVMTTSGNETFPTQIEHPACGAVTDFTLISVRPGPSAVFFDPIFPADDPQTLVGLIGTSINWAEVLTNIVPDFVNGLDCVISNNDGISHTYVIENGVPILREQEGDWHDSAFDAYNRSILLNDLETGASASVSYTLTLYPTQVLFDEFSSNSPMWAAVGFAAVIFVCTLIFFVYDHFMKYKAHQRKMILRMKRRFVRFVSHEIRTPLNVVIMGLDLMLAELRGKQEQEQRERELFQQKNPPLVVLEKNQDGRGNVTEHGNPDSLTDPSTPDENVETETEQLLQLAVDIQENSNNAVTVLSDLLNYDKVEAGTFELEYGSVDIFKSVGKTVSEFTIQAKNRNMTIHFAAEADSGSPSSTSKDDVETALLPQSLRHLFVLGDERRLNLVTRNLISNALKFCDNKDIQVTVSHVPKIQLPHKDKNLKKLMDDEESEAYKILSSSECVGAVAVTVVDQGVGLSQDQLALLFGEGVQFNPEILQNGGGSGLGLFITSEIVKQHDGTIGADSDGIGCGTSFAIHLPLYKSTRVETATETNTSVGSSSQQDYRRNVLVVDDVLTNRKMLVRVLERAGHTCEMASDGLEAVETFLDNKKRFEACEIMAPFDTILMDYEMPNLNGPDATRRLRELGCTAAIFGVTGNVLAEDVATFKSNGADIVLYKPIRLPHLDTAWEKMDARRKDTS
jgi:signal transduction histidine kinase